jgi:hypothetical protein
MDLGKRRKEKAPKTNLPLLMKGLSAVSSKHERKEKPKEASAQFSLS